LGSFVLLAKPEHIPAQMAGFLLQGLHLSRTETGDIQMTAETPLCPECDAEVDIPADAMENELIACAECGIELEIMSLEPLTLELAPDVEEDWGE